MNEKRLLPKRCAMLSGDPVRKLSMQMTSLPSCRNRSQRCEPMNPAPPVMSTRVIVTSARCADRRAADRQVREAMLAHDYWIVQVAPVEDDGTAHELFHTREIGTPELRPLGDDEQRGGVGKCIVVHAVIAHPFAEDGPGHPE